MVGWHCGLNHLEFGYLWGGFGGIVEHDVVQSSVGDIGGEGQDVCVGQNSEEFAERLDDFRIGFGVEIAGDIEGFRGLSGYIFQNLH